MTSSASSGFSTIGSCGRSVDFASSTSSLSSGRLPTKLPSIFSCWSATRVVGNCSWPPNRPTLTSFPPVPSAPSAVEEVTPLLTKSIAEASLPPPALTMSPDGSSPVVRTVAVAPAASAFLSESSETSAATMFLCPRALSSATALRPTPPVPMTAMGRSASGVSAFVTAE